MLPALLLFPLGYVLLAVLLSRHGHGPSAGRTSPAAHGP